MTRFRFIVLSVIIDSILVVASLAGAFYIRFLGTPPQFNFSAFITAAPFIVGAYLFAGWIYGLYEPERIDTPWSTTRATFLTAVIGTLFAAVVLFLGGEATAAFARWVFLFAGVLIFAVLIAWRIVFLRLGALSWPMQNILIIGSGEIAKTLALRLKEREKWGLNVVGYLAGITQLTESKMNHAAREFGLSIGVSAVIPKIGTLSEVSNVIETYQVNRVIVADPVDLREIIEGVALQGSGRVVVDIVPELYEIFLGKTDSIVGDIPLMRLSERGLPRYQRIIKPVIDYVCASALLVILSPVFALSALAIKIDDGGPVFYRQMRVGKKQKEFEIYKFRTMQVDAEAQSGPVLARETDERVTRIGSILRKSRIDELPQLVNIFKGQMSFIGPRPERPYFVKQFLVEIVGYSERFRALPGVTGIAQVNGGYATTPELKLKYDLMYVYHQDFVLDLQVVIETLKVVLTARGAR